MLSLIVLFPIAAKADELSVVAGHYRYEQYSVTLPNRRVIGLGDLGASEAFLDISANGTITLRMTMKAGNVVTQTAKVVEAHLSAGKGFWLAQWPDMKTPVRARVSMSVDGLVSDTQFDDKSDAERFGAVEHAVLRRLESK
jgi:hypothetical protein